MGVSGPSLLIESTYSKINIISDFVRDQNVAKTATNHSITNVVTKYVDHGTVICG